MTATLRRVLEALCGTLAASALFGIMWLTLVDVAGRKAISTSVPGSLELTELLMVLVIFAGLPLVSLRGEHVVFDSLDPHAQGLGAPGSRAWWSICCARRRWPAWPG